MLSRRELIAGGAVSNFARGDAAKAQQGGSESDSARALRGISDILESIRSQHTIATPAFTQLRDRQRQGNRTLVIVTHDRRFITPDDLVLEIEDGRLKGKPSHSPMGAAT